MTFNHTPFLLASEHLSSFQYVYLYKQNFLILVEFAKVYSRAQEVVHIENRKCLTLPQKHFFCCGLKSFIVKIKYLSPSFRGTPTSSVERRQRNVCLNTSADFIYTILYTINFIINYIYKL